MAATVADMLQEGCENRGSKRARSLRENAKAALLKVCEETEDWPNDDSRWLARYVVDSDGGEWIKVKAFFTEQEARTVANKLSNLSRQTERRTGNGS